MDRVDRIDTLLKKLGIFLGNQRMRRFQLASTLAQAKTEFNETIGLALLREAQLRDANNPSALIASWLKDGSWEKMLRELQEAGDFAALIEDPKAGRKESSNIGGRLDLASAENPYGWTDPERAVKTHKDINIPGAWNPFRQSYNLTVKQAQQHNRGSEYRRRRCSCLEIVGHSETRAERAENIKRWEQQPEWDPMEVERARGRYYGEPGDTGSVFGEEA